MQHVITDQIADFTAVYDQDVEMISVTRPEMSKLESLAEDLITSRAHVEMRWNQSAVGAKAPIHEGERSMGPDLRSALNEEILFAGEVLHELLGCERIGVRLAKLHRPMCPRFHVDQVPCRLLATINGPGTEWIAANDVDPQLFGARDTEDLPIKTGGSLRQLKSGQWSLLKGGAWQEEFNGVVHRSPHQDGNRLLLTFDPVFAD